MAPWGTKTAEPLCDGDYFSALPGHQVSLWGHGRAVILRMVGVGRVSTLLYTTGVCKAWGMWQ